MAQPIWNTAAGSLGTAPSLVVFNYLLSAEAVSPASGIESYDLISGSVPKNLVLFYNGMISGTPALVTEATTSTFVVRATDDLGNIRDRTFSLTITGSAIPTIDTPAGTLLETWDSVWVSTQIAYTNPDSNNPIKFSVLEGALPSGLEINESGLIRGYAAPPMISLALPLVETIATETSASDYITCLSTIDFTIGREVVFTGTSLGGVVSGQTYYIKSILSSTKFTISETQGGDTVNLNSDTGFMNIELPETTVGQPTIRTYNFILKLSSPLGSDTASYSITVINQNTPVSQGGPGYPINTRTPTIYNTRPPTFNINDTDPYYGYYLAPTATPSSPAEMGTFQSDN